MRVSTYVVYIMEPKYAQEAVVGGGMGLVNRHFYIPAMRATLAVILAMGSPLAGGTLQMAGWRLFGSC